MSEITVSKGRRQKEQEIIEFLIGHIEEGKRLYFFQELVARITMPTEEAMRTLKPIFAACRIPGVTAP
jgi:hypothetical protein